MSSEMVTRWVAKQKPRAHTMRAAPTFYRNLEEALDKMRKNQGLYSLYKNTWTGSNGTTVDFCSNDTLSLNNSGRLRLAFEEELARNPDMHLGSCGSRILDGNYDYIEQVEEEVRKFHGAEAALLVGSGRDANYAVLEGVPRPGDAIVFDELVHASIMHGMGRSRCAKKASFAHNNVQSLRETLLSVRDSEPLIKQGLRCVLVICESFYSMEGDMAPLAEYVRTVKEIFPEGNAQFMVDEAHSIGLVGEKGLGFVHKLGLDSEIAIKTITYSKAFGSIGGAVLCNDTVKTAMMNFARSTAFTAAPAFHQVAAIRAGYTLMAEPETVAGRDNIQYLVKRFFAKISALPTWKEANERQILNVPLLEGWETRDFQTQLIMLWTTEKYSQYLFFHLHAAKFTSFPVVHPAVPKGGGRLRVVIHADHTEQEIDGMVAAIGDWLEEMLHIEHGTGRGKVPEAARFVRAML